MRIRQLVLPAWARRTRGCSKTLFILVRKRGEIADAAYESESQPRAKKSITTISIAWFTIGKHNDYPPFKKPDEFEISLIIPNCCIKPYKRRQTVKAKKTKTRL
jgi:hypothetical protein